MTQPIDNNDPSIKNQNPLKPLEKFQPSFSTEPGDKGMEAFKRWLAPLGPEAYKKFMENLMGFITSQIRTEEARARKAAEKLKRAEKGEDE